MAKGFIYFAVCDALGTVKIGYTADPKSRLNGIQNGCPFPIHYEALIPGTREDERLIQKALVKHRILREWFWWNNEVKKVLSQAKEVASI